MYCRQCGARVDDAPLCPKCGAASGPQPPKTRGRFMLGRRGVVALIAAVLVVAGGVLAVVLLRPAAPPPTAAQPAAEPATQPAASTEAPAAASSLTSGFKWSGLPPDQIRDARSALDAAIAHEEQTAAHAPAGSAGTQDQIPVGTAPSGTKDGVRL
jgi:hypothetical protein